MTVRLDLTPAGIFVGTGRIPEDLTEMPHDIVAGIHGGLGSVPWGDIVGTVPRFHHLDAVPIDDALDRPVVVIDHGAVAVEMTGSECNLQWRWGTMGRAGAG